MRIPIIPIGNSKGIRIPKSILRQLDMPDLVDLEVHEKEIVLRPSKRTSREGWDEAFAEMAENGEDELVLEEIQDKENFEWEW
jgi:antitoxin MazE